MPVSPASSVTQTTSQPFSQRFVDLCAAMIAESERVKDQKLARDLQQFITACFTRELALPRTKLDMLKAQMLCRRLLLASKRYDLVYEWYPLFKSPAGANEQKSLATYAHELAQGRAGWAWISGYESVLECGCGAAALGLVLSGANRRWLATDICYPAGLETLAKIFPPAAGFEFREVDGITLSGIDDASVAAVVSRSFLEHLLLEDAAQHVAQAYRVLKPGGELIIACPAGVGPPSDITAQFPEYDTPQGLHIKEYRVAEMAELLTQAGFVKLRSRFLRTRWVGKLLGGRQELDFISLTSAARLEGLAEKSWPLLRKTALSRKLWKLCWGHLGAASILVVARKA